MVNHAPDWASFRGEIECPLCGYNLRGLKEARCPECGGAFEWRDLLDPKRRHHAYLFEYHPGANVWSFLRTMIAGVNPLRFWRSVHPVLPIRMGRLRGYLFLVFLVMLASFAFGLVAIELSRSGWLWRAPGARFTGSAIMPWTWTPNDLRIVLEVNSHLLNVLVWFAATFGAMLVFQGSMRRKRIRAGHLFRCMVYSSDVFVWLAIALFGLDLLESWFFDDWVVVAQYLAYMLAAIAATVRLMFAFRIYLQFPHAVLTVLATQVIATLVIINMYIVWVWV